MSDQGAQWIVGWHMHHGIRCAVESLALKTLAGHQGVLRKNPVLKFVCTVMSMRVISQHLKSWELYLVAQMFLEIIDRINPCSPSKANKRAPTDTRVLERRVAQARPRPLEWPPRFSAFSCCCCRHRAQVRGPVTTLPSSLVATKSGHILASFHVISCMQYGTVQHQIASIAFRFPAAQI